MTTLSYEQMRDYVDKEITSAHRQLAQGQIEMVQSFNAVAKEASEEIGRQLRAHEIWHTQQLTEQLRQMRADGDTARGQVLSSRQLIIAFVIALCTLASLGLGVLNFTVTPHP